MIQTGPVRNFETAGRSFNLMCSMLQVPMENIHEADTLAGSVAEKDLLLTARQYAEISQANDDVKEGMFAPAKQAHPEASEALEAMFQEAADRAQAKNNLPQARVVPMSLMDMGEETGEAGMFMMPLVAYDPAAPQKGYDAGALVVDVTPNSDGTVFVIAQKPPGFPG